MIQENGTMGYKFVQIEALAWKYSKVFEAIKNRMISQNNTNFETIQKLEMWALKYSTLADQIKQFN